MQGTRCNQAAKGGQSVSRKAGRWVGQSVGQSVGQLVGQLVGQSVCQLVRWSIGRSVRQSVSQSVCGQCAAVQCSVQHHSLAAAEVEHAAVVGQGGRGAA